MIVSTAHAATEAAGGAHDVGFPPFETETYLGQLIWLALIFGLLYVLMKRVVLPRLSGIIETRQVTIARDLDEAAAMKTKAEAAGAAYDKSLAEAKARAQALAQETRDAITAENDAKRKALEADLAQRMAEAEATSAARKTEAMTNVRGIARDTTAAIVERLIGRQPSAQAIDSALDATTH